MKTNKQMSFPELAEWVIDRTLKAGANGCKVNLSKRRFVEINYREHRPDILKEATIRDLNLGIYVGNKFANQSTPDIRLSSLETFITGLIESTVVMEEDPFRSLPDSRLYSGRSATDLEKNDPDYENLTPEKRHSYAQKAENACLLKGGEKSISVEVGIYDEKYEEYVRTSNGFEASSVATAYQLAASMYGQDIGDRRPNGYQYSIATHLKDLTSPDQVGTEAAIRTLDLFGAIKIPTTRLPVIVENRVVEVILRFLLNSLSGRNIQQKRSCFADKKGQKIGSRLFTLIDDPFILKGLGSKLYDNDGFPTKKMNLFTEGILNEFIIDWYYSRKLECNPTIGANTNVIIPPGVRSVEAIIKDLPGCLLITDFLGGNSNPTTGDFSIGIFGKYYVKGQLKQNIAEMNIADNHLNFWNKLIEVANDPWVNSTVRVPSLVFEDVLVSGI